MIRVRLGVVSRFAAHEVMRTSCNWSGRTHGPIDRRDTCRCRRGQAERAVFAKRRHPSWGAVRPRYAGDVPPKAPCRQSRRQYGTLHTSLKRPIQIEVVASTMPAGYWRSSPLAPVAGQGRKRGRMHRGKQVAGAVASTSLRRIDLLPFADGAIAQLGERYNGIVEVAGSIPAGSTIDKAGDL